MNLIAEQTTTEAAALLERSMQLSADVTALVNDIKAFSLSRCDIPEELSPQVQNELYGWAGEALAVGEMYGMLEVIVSTIVSHHESGVPDDVLSTEAVAERVALAELALAALNAGEGTRALMPAS